GFPDSAYTLTRRSRDAEDLHLGRLALHAHGRQRVERHAAVEPPRGGAADEDVGADLLGESLDARGEIDGVADERVGEPLAAADGAGEHQARVHADAVAQRSRSAAIP